MAWLFNCSQGKWNSSNCLLSNKYDDWRRVKRIIFVWNKLRFSGNNRKRQ
jgi:hypothetical protein